MITKEQSEVLWELVCKYETAIQESTRNEGCKFFEGRQDYACELLFNYVTSITATDAAVLPGDGWIEWAGGNNPLRTGQLVDVKFRSGVISKNSAGLSQWMDWEHTGSHADIVAYRIVRN